MKIAMIGPRGVPAAHGGFETCVEEVGWRLAEKGHIITVYSRRSGRKLKEYRGMNIVYVPRIPIRGFESLFAALLSVLHALLFEKFDVVMIFDNANAPVLALCKLFKKACSINTDGLGWQRDKWGYWAKKYYKWTEGACVKLCENVVTDSVSMKNYYFNNYGAVSTMIAYGANLPGHREESVDRECLAKFNLSKQRYFLQVTRFEPENNPLLSLQAFLKIDRSNLKIVLIGGANGSTEYSKAIEKEAGKNSTIVLPGFIYEKGILDSIWTNCLAYIHGNQIGGTNPALLQAMAAGRPVIARDCIFNREVLDNNGYFYDKSIESLSDRMDFVSAHVQEAEKKAASALQRVKRTYNWDIVASQYEVLFASIVVQKTRKW